jgi:NAD(P)H-hydrate epimerase
MRPLGENVFMSFMAFVPAALPAREGRNRTRLCLRMSDAPSSVPSTQEPRRARFVTAEVGRLAQSDSVAYANGFSDKVAIRCAEGVAEALSQAYDVEDFSRVFVVCGPGFNGAVGIYTALALKQRGFAPTVYWISGVPSQINTAATKELDNAGLPVCDFAPSTVDFYYDLVVDALLGVGFDGGDIRPHYWNIFEMLLGTELPVLSVDVPSGWDLDIGPRNIDVSADTFVKPDTLVSLGVPKNGTKFFSGSYHFIAGRHLPPRWLEERDLYLPSYPGSDAACVIFSSNAAAVNPSNGEIYGRAGQFQATLYTRNPRRKWISDAEIDNNPEMWDELD